MINKIFDPSRETRDILTRKIINWGFWLITILGASTIIISLLENSEKTLEAAKYIFNAIVPLIAAWVGAVIAFYYGRDNYESATRQALALTKDTLDDIKVRNIMIHRKTIVAQKSNLNQEDSLKLEGIIELYTKIEKDRVPIFTLDNKPLYIIHLSTITDFLRRKNGDPASISIKEVIDEKKNFYRYESIKGFVTISENTPLQEAIEKMKKIESCKDIFVTKNGKTDEEVVGWLTDSLINRFLTI